MSRSVVLVGLVVLATGILLLWSSHQQTTQAAATSSSRRSPSSTPPTARSQENARAELMDLKLDYTKKVLEGLVREQMDDVAKNARELKLLSAAAGWEPKSVPGPAYLDYTREFQRIAETLSDRADADNLDGATLAYVELTLNCVNCHKFVRTATD